MTNEHVSNDPGDKPKTMNKVRGDVKGKDVSWLCDKFDVKLAQIRERGHFVGQHEDPNFKFPSLLEFLNGSNGASP